MRLCLSCESVLISCSCSLLVPVFELDRWAKFSWQIIHKNITVFRLRLDPDAMSQNFQYTDTPGRASFLFYHAEGSDGQMDSRTTGPSRSCSISRQLALLGGAFTSSGSEIRKRPPPQSVKEWMIQTIAKFKDQGNAITF